MKVLDRRSHPYRRLIKHHPVLAGRSLLATGSFSAVFETADSVLKLTLDPHAYHLLLAAQARQLLHFPQVIHDYGQVGDYNRHLAFHLLELERLSPIKAGHDLYTRMLKFKGRVDFWRRKARWQLNAGDDRALLMMLEQDPLDQGLRAGLELIVSCLQTTEAGFDTNSKNFMHRGDGRLILADPVAHYQAFDLETLDEQA